MELRLADPGGVGAGLPLEHAAATRPAPTLAPTPTRKSLRVMGAGLMNWFQGTGWVRVARLSIPGKKGRRLLRSRRPYAGTPCRPPLRRGSPVPGSPSGGEGIGRSEEHTSELQSPYDLV